ncbi:MAG: cell division protein FtsQ/DivIB [Candidatus Omnitrophica bacterium]|nr:cell division protein FtsQ/DivIB [Candidatus Omnitrophota bacterium]
MTRYKLDLPRPKNKKRGFSLNVVVVIIVLGLLVLGCLSLGKAIKNLDCFKIRQVIIKGNGSIDLSYLKGRNIFDLDLDQASRNLKEFYPTFKSIRLIRVLPDALSVEFFKRQPLGIVKLYRYYCVDDEGVLFDLPQDFDPVQLPVIVGLETKIFGPKTGRAYNIRELNFALDIIKEINKSHALRGYKLQTINLTHPAETFFILAKSTITPITKEASSFEVKIGTDYLKDRIDILESLLVQMKEKNTQINYIDLRFKEPVIKYRDAK